MNIRYEVIAAANGAPGNKRLFAFLCGDAPADALAKAQRSTDWLERAAIAMNPNTPPDVVQRLAKDGNAVVRSIAAHALMPSAPPVSKQPLERDSPDSSSTKSTYQTIAIELIERIRKAGFTYGLVGTRWYKYLKVSQRFGYPTEISPYATESKEMSRLGLQFPSFDSVGLLPASIQEVVWQGLASDEDAAVRKAVARHPSFPAALFQSFASDPEPYVRKALLSRNDLPHILRIKILTEFFEKKEEWASVALAADPLCSLATMQKLSKTRSFEVFEALAKNPSYPAEMLEPLLKSMADLIRKNGHGSFFAPTRLNEIVNASTFPSTVLQSLVKSKDSLLKLAAETAQSINLTVAAVQCTDSMSVAIGISPKPIPDFDTLAVSTSNTDQLLAVEHQACPPSILELLAGHNFDKIRIKVALHPICPLHVLETLSSDTDAWVRRAVAFHLVCPPSIRDQLLQRLSVDPNYFIRQSVAEHPLTPIETLAMLAHDNTRAVRDSVRKPDCRKLNQDSFNARDPQTASEELMRLAQSGFYLTRLEALSNPSFPAGKRSVVLAETARDISGWLDLAKIDTSSDTFEEHDIRQALECLNLIPNVTDKKALSTASLSKDWLERSAVLLTNGTPQSVIRLLSGDENETIRCLAMERLSQVPTVCKASN